MTADCPSAFNALRKVVELLWKLKADMHRGEDTPYAPPHRTATTSVSIPGTCSIINCSDSSFEMEAESDSQKVVQHQREKYFTKHISTLPYVCSPPPDRGASSYVSYIFFTANLKEKKCSISKYFHCDNMHVFKRPPTSNKPVILSLNSSARSGQMLALSQSHYNTAHSSRLDYMKL